MLFWGVSSSLGAPSGRLPVTSLSQARALTVAEVLSNTVPCQVEGTVLFVDEPWRNWFLHDGAVGMYFMGDYVSDTHLPPLRAGQRVRLSGTVGPGGFSPVIQATNVVVLEEGSWPEAHAPNLDRLVAGQEDSQWIELRGVVEMVGRVDGHNVLQLLGAFGSLDAYFPSSQSVPLPKGWVGAQVRVHAIGITKFNERSQLVGVSLAIPRPEDVMIDVPAEGDPFALPVRAFDKLLTFDPTATPNRRVHVQGIVTLQQRNGRFYLQADGRGLQVTPAEPLKLAVGTRVSAVGFVRASEPFPILEYAEVRVIGPGEAPVPLPLEAKKAEDFREPVLVELEAEFQGGQRRNGEEVGILLTTNRQPFEAVLESDPEDRPVLNAFRAHSWLRLRGVFNANTASGARSVSRFKVLLRDSHDLTLVKNGTWWDSQRALSLAGGLAVLIVGAVFWNTQLRRTVSQQTQALRDQLEKERALELRYRDLLENAVDMIFVIDLDGRVLQVNASALRCFGLSHGEMLRSNVMQFVAPHQRELVRQRFASIRATGRVEYASLVIDVVTPRNEHMAIEVASRVVQRAGEAPELEIVGRDITARRHAEGQRDLQRSVLELIARGTPLQAVLDALMLQIERQCPGMHCSVLRLDVDGVTLRHASAPSLPGTYVTKVDGLHAGEGVGSCGTAVARRQAVIVHDIQRDPLWNREYGELAKQHGLGACWSFPIFSTTQQILGTMACYYGQPRSPQAEEIRLIETACSLISVALERHRADLAVRTSEERLRTCIDQTPNVAVQWYDEKGRVVFWNRASETLFGWSSEEAVGKTLDQLIHTPEAAADFARLVTRLKTKGGQHGPAESVFQHRNGQIGTCVYTLFPLPSLEGPALFVCMDVDVTAIKQAEAALRESEKRHRSVVAALSEGVMLVAADGYPVTVNDSALRILGLGREQLMGANLKTSSWQVIHEDGSRFVPEDFPISVALRTGRPVRDVIQGVRRPDGQLVWVCVNATPVEVVTGDRVGKVVVSFSDVTIRRQAQEELVRAKEAAEAASRAKTDFLAMISHEIRTPLNGVIGFTYLLLDGSLPPEQNRFVETIKQSAEALLAIINDILDFSKIEAGKLQLVSEHFSVGDTVAAVAELLSPRAEERRLELALEISPHLPATMEGDSARVRQVLMNLVGNALKFTDEGHVLVEAGLSDGMVRLSVTDTGSGIPPDKHDLLFKRFSQVETASTRRHGGTGLGLAISRQLVELMGGQIGFESEPGQGSTFWFTLPLGASVPAPAPAPVLKGTRALILNATEINQRVLIRQMGVWGCHARAVATDALLAELTSAAASGRAWDMVVADVAEPSALLARLLRMVRAGTSWPVPAVIILHHRSTSAGFFQDSCDATLVKPVAVPGLLLSTLQAAMEARRRQGQDGPKAGSSAVEALPSPPQLLLVEDDGTSTLFTTRLLQRAGCEVTVVGSGEEAVVRVRQQAFQLILLDCRMPGLDPVAITEALQNASVAGSATRIVGLLSDFTEDERNTLMSSGLDDCLEKPLRGAGLNELLRRWLPGMAA